jgi:CheY-like chemotaxis protein
MQNNERKDPPASCDDIRALLRLVVEGRGHMVEQAHQGSDGAASVVWQLDLAVVDIRQGVSDIALARRLREALGAGVRLIALTGCNGAAALTAGFDAFLLEPPVHGPPLDHRPAG